jgi:Glycosyltransferase family 87
MNITSPQASSARIRSSAAKVYYFCAYACFIVLVTSLCFDHTEGNGYTTFGTYWASGHAAINDLNPYAAYPETFQNGSTLGPDLNFNPPCVLPLLQLLSHLPIRQFAVVWTIAMGLFFAAGAALLVRNHPALQARQIFWLLFSVPTLSTLVLGQIYGLPFFLSTLAWLFFRKNNKVGAAIAIGMFVAIRPTMVFWPLLLMAAGHWKLAIRSLGVVAILYALPLPIYGLTVYREWFAALRSDNHGAIRMNIAIIPVLSRFGFHLAGIVIAIAVAVLLGWWAWKKSPDFISVSGAGICAGILCAPLAWFHYVIFLAPLFVARPWRLIATAAACLFLLPVSLSIASGGVPYLAAVLMILHCFIWPHPMKVYDPPPLAEGAEIETVNA